MASKSWNDVLLKALDARRNMDIAQGKRSWYKWDAAHKLVLAVRKDIRQLGGNGAPYVHSFLPVAATACQLACSCLAEFSRCC